jgi:hypothetical protein
MVTLNGNPFYGLTYTHTKTNVRYFYDYITMQVEGAFDTLVDFPSEREAKLWLISKSSIQSLKHYMYALACLPDEELDKIIAKGKYKLSKAMMRECDINISNSSTRTSFSRADYPLLCEFVIVEYEANVLQSKQGNDVDSIESSDK